MPIFEFVCTDCGNNFEELVRTSSAVDLVECPVCSSGQVRKKVSTFASKLSSGSSYSLGSSSAAASCSPGGT
jgi:putative FmdB family regulatory protein